MLIKKQRQKLMNGKSKENINFICSPESRPNPITQENIPLPQKKSFVQTSEVWQKLIDKTSTEKVERSDKNYCGRRSTESFLSARTLNP